MKISNSALSMALALTMAGGSPALASLQSQGLPPQHPPVRGMDPTLARFSKQFKCPYAKDWLTKGPQQAAMDLGLTTPEKIEAAKRSNAADPVVQGRRRHLQEVSAAASVMGSCSFSNQWTGPSCLEFRGEGWDNNSMDERCGLEQDNTVTMGGDGCPKPSELAGWCVKEVATGKIEATSMMISAMSDCDGNQMACESFVGGAFEAASACGGGASVGGGMMGGGVPSEYANMGPPAEGDNKCLIAPGAIGAAHQLGFSDGYSNTCPGTPAEGSPYMWPMAWSADVDTQSLAYGVDEVMYHTQGRTFYRLDKNWKRSDTVYAKGILRSVGQGPCENRDLDSQEEGIPVACNTDMDMNRGDPMETMIHKGNKMYFITWKNTTNVTVGATDPSLMADCMYMDLMVIGNIRPDWFLDDRGDDTDVQYLGDQHVYYASRTPRLTKQWRKKDFASQYFTMSMAGNPPSQAAADDPDYQDIRWPLILNIPGEGFGDDMLQSYANHTLLTDDDDDLFELVQNYEASGGSCPPYGGNMEGEDGESEIAFGPPVGGVHIPSNLEVDENSWFSNVYTFSPVWQPPLIVEEMSASSTGFAVTEKQRVRVESCYDPSSKSVQLNVEFTDIEPIPVDSGLELPWMALGYREDEVCAMTPVDGGDTTLIYVSKSPEQDVPKPYMGLMSAATRSFDPSAIGSLYQSLWPLEESMGYSGVSLSTPMLGNEDSSPTMAAMSRSATPNPTSVVLSFRQEFETKPEVMHLMYGIGSTPQFGFHTSRSCFDIVDFPTCPPMSPTVGDADLASSRPNSIADPMVEGISINLSESSSAGATLSTFLGALVTLGGSLFLAF